MKTSIIFLLAVTTSCFGQARFGGSAAFKGAAAIQAVPGGGGGGGSYLYRQDFNSGSSAPSGWTAHGSVTWNYTTSPAPLEGAQSMEFATSGGANYASYDYGSGATEWYGYFIVSDNGGNDTLLQTSDNGGNFPFQIESPVGGGNQSLRVVVGGTASSTTVATFTAPTTVHVWWHYKTGTGNAIGEVWWSTTTTKPANGSNNYSSTTTATSTYSLETFYLNAGGAVTIYDDFILNNSSIGSAP